MHTCRNVEDTSITIQNKKRDYYVALDGLLCVGGEDKTSERDYQVRWTRCVGAANVSTLPLPSLKRLFGMPPPPTLMICDWQMRHEHVVLKSSLPTQLRTMSNSDGCFIVLAESLPRMHRQAQIGQCSHVRSLGLHSPHGSCCRYLWSVCYEVGSYS